MKMRRKEQGDIFGLSFMDCICCGFGAVILMFVLTTRQEVISEGAFTNDVNADVDRAESRMQAELDRLAEVKSNLEKLEEQFANAEERLQESQADAERLAEEKDKAMTVVKEASSEKAGLVEERSTLVEKVHEAEKELERESAGGGTQKASGKSISSFNGSEKRHYLTGMKVDGDYNVILVDRSASMLANRISAIDHFRPADGTANSLVSRKWVRVLDTVDWLLANINYDDGSGGDPPFVQVLSYNESVHPALPGEPFEWIAADDDRKMQQLSSALWDVVPSGGSNLEAALLKALELRPRPDNVFLITDSLPSHSSARPTGSRVSWNDRNLHYSRAFSIVQRNRLPVNILLFELDGDPWSAGNYWRMADVHDGSLMVPSLDWPN